MTQDTHEPNMYLAPTGQWAFRENNKIVAYSQNMTDTL